MSKRNHIYTIHVFLYHIYSEGTQVLTHYSVRYLYVCEQIIASELFSHEYELVFLEEVCVRSYERYHIKTYIMLHIYVIIIYEVYIYISYSYYNFIYKMFSYSYITKSYINFFYSRSLTSQIKNDLYILYKMFSYSYII